MFDFLRVLGTKKFFEKGTIVLQGLVQDGGARISLVLTSSDKIAWTWLGRAPERLPVKAASENKNMTKINKNVFVRAHFPIYF